MNQEPPRGTDNFTADFWNGFGWMSQAADYAIDAAQRALLFADVKRKRGDQYKAHLAEKVPNVLNFPGELVMSGWDLPRPVNYGLARIIPPAGYTVDPAKRPFVIVDPRAGHGPGIGGFKPDSEIGAALKEGHPCYFVGFLPDPVPGQTVEDVMRAEAAFIRHVGELHPGDAGKPVVIGNCQAGWQILMTAAVWPEIFGPIIVAGAPLSYWAGDKPMRYAGGLMGGSWLTAFTGDTGAGRFDGAWLVQNFENLDPANTLWKKDYDLYSKVDTEALRYLGFEKYWGGYVFLNDVEMQYIVDNLFIGNRLATAQLLTSDGVRIDLRNIRSPILVFCSYGDNITPPPQALGWITDLYRTDDEVIGHDQTIVYATHDSIGHLGIFVSSSVGRKEHREFASAIDLIDLLPAGIYQATVEDDPDKAASGDDDRHHLAIHRRGVGDVRQIVQPDPAAERRFAAVERLSQTNLALYRRFAQPLVRACVSTQSASWLARLHPMRLSHQWSTGHPFAAQVEALADAIKDRRSPVPADNPFLVAQGLISDAVVRAFDTYRDTRDRAYAAMFDLIYGSPLVQALAGLQEDDGASPRRHPGDTAEHRAFVARELEQMHVDVRAGGLVEASLRAIFYVLRQRGSADGRRFESARQLFKDQVPNDLTLARFRAIAREQARLMYYDLEGTIEAIPDLLTRADPDLVREAAESIESLLRGEVQLTHVEETGLKDMKEMFLAAAQRVTLEPPAKMALPPPCEENAKTSGRLPAPASTATGHDRRPRNPAR